MLLITKASGQEAAARDVSLVLTAIAIGLLALAFLFAFILVSGCSDVKTAALDAVSPVVVLKGSAQYEKMYPEAANTSNVSNSSVIITELTTIPTETPVTVIPTKDLNFVDPYSEGERYEYQWYRWHWNNVSGLQQAERGIVVYNHKYLDSFSYWDDAWGNYYKHYPSAGYRFLAVFVHQEDFSPDNSGVWGYQNKSFYVQYGGQLHQPYNGFNQVYRIAELEEMYGNYYSIEYIRPYGVIRIFGGIRDAVTGGYHLQEQYSLWSGQSNAWDGYILYEVPKSATDSDIRIVGNFAGKNVNWKFDGSQHAQKYPITQSSVSSNMTKQTVPVTTENQGKV